jgi:hypothetical protein
MVLTITRADTKVLGEGMRRIMLSGDSVVITTSTIIRSF